MSSTQCTQRPSEDMVSITMKRMQHQGEQPRQHHTARPTFPECNSSCLLSHLRHEDKARTVIKWQWLQSMQLMRFASHPHVLVGSNSKPERQHRATTGGRLRALSLRRLRSVSLERNQIRLVGLTFTKIVCCRNDGLNIEPCCSCCRLCVHGQPATSM